MRAAGIIFSNLNKVIGNRLTADRTVAAIPFACRYRLCDFALSAMVNADISSIHIIANYNYHSLVEHIGSGKDFDLARHGAGIRMITPYQNSRLTGTKPYTTHLETLIDVSGILSDVREEYTVCSDSDIPTNVDLADVLERHRETGAEITLVTARTPPWQGRHPRVTVRADEEGRVREVALKDSTDGGGEELFLNIFVMRTDTLRTLLSDAAARNLTSFSRDILMRKAEGGGVYRYLYGGYYAFLADFGEYYSKSMELVRSEEARRALLGVRGRPIYTKVHNTAPTRYGEGAAVLSSMIADDCVINGRVENSILFRGVRIGKGSVVRNSVLFGGTAVGQGVTLDAVVCDKRVYISDGRTLVGCEELPLFVPKGKRL